jgi:hypothetical protein
MNLVAYKNQLIEFASQLNEQPFKSPSSYSDFQNKVYNFLDQNYEIYINSNNEDRKEIRIIIKKYNRRDVLEGGPLSAPLSYLLQQYVYKTIRQLKTTGDATWLRRGLVVISILDGTLNPKDDMDQLAHLFVVAEEKGLNPKPEFHSIAEISNKETSISEEMPMSEMIVNIPNIAHEINDEREKWFLVTNKE